MTKQPAITLARLHRKSTDTKFTAAWSGYLRDEDVQRSVEKDFAGCVVIGNSIRRMSREQYESLRRGTDLAISGATT